MSNSTYILRRINELNKTGVLDARQTVQALATVQSQVQLGKRVSLAHIGISDDVLYGREPEQEDKTIHDETFEFIVDYKRKHDGNSPPYRTIMKKFGLASTSAVSARIDKLIADGRLRRNPDRQRSGVIEVVGGKWDYHGI